ncbi:hypothetical protein DL95DRAFT_380634 [Leptodontidium sp. 2 PMI_412]|nr:hypothetical protein DL95DRAFT_380634 [Leptodontidium sp. 2 PMI_412]
MAFDLSDSESAELQTFLAEKYNSPSAEWLAGLEKKFTVLQALLEQGQASTNNGPNNTDNEPGTSPSAARAAALPVVSLIYCTHFIGTDEPLTCYAFGTISQSTFEDIFWQKIDEAKNESPEIGIEVYAAQDAYFNLHFGGYQFRILYCGREGLVRRYPNVLDAPAEFLKHWEADDVVAQLIMIQGLRFASDRLLSDLGSDVSRVVFYYLRAYAIERGAYYNLFISRHDNRVLHTGHILGLMRTALPRLTNKGHPWTLRNVVAEVFNMILTGQTFVNSCHTSREPLPERVGPAVTPFSQSVLMRVRAQPMATKLNFPSFIKINVEYNGASSIAHGKLLAMIEGQIRKLRNSVSILPKMVVPKDSPPSCLVWPGRLIEMSTESRKANDWVYVMGIKYPKTDLETKQSLENMVNAWTRELTSREDFDDSSCFVSANLLDSSEMGGTFFHSTESFRRQPIPGPKRNEVPVNDSDANKSPKKKKQKVEHSSNGPSTSLRTASDVLSRLKYDPDTFDIDDFRIGYEDRVEGRIKEKPAANWELDTQHDDFIPEHRIEYFKKCPQNGGSPEIMWDKGKRIDKIFNSGNSKEL